VHSPLLVRHFLSQFVESDWATDAGADSHQNLALVAAGIVTIPLFATVFMAMRYLTRLLPGAGWTGTTGLEDQITFCLTSMLVAAAVAALEWDALALSHRDSMILGVLPVPHRDLVQAKGPGARHLRGLVRRCAQPAAHGAAPRADGRHPAPASLHGSSAHGWRTGSARRWPQPSGSPA
jgi:hypothetical protein